MLLILKETGRKVNLSVANPLDYIAFIQIIITEKSIVIRIKYLFILILQITLSILCLFFNEDIVLPKLIHITKAENYYF